MNAKQIIALVVGLLALGITAWKGPQAWGLVATGLTAIVILVSTLRIVPKEDEEYIQDLEDALRVATTPQNDVTNSGLAGKSRARFAWSIHRRINTP